MLRGELRRGVRRGSGVLQNGVEHLLPLCPAVAEASQRGNVEPGEPPEAAALREIREETGIEAELIPGFREEVEYWYVKAGRRVRKKVIYFLARAPTKEVRLSWEHKGYAWLPYSQALARATYQTTKQVLAKAHKKLAELQRR
ncbi:MAG: bis(5'-nucleosyl)-tetraphosphatase [Thermoproteus sp.]